MGGDLVKGQACPRCGEFTVVYNGNYWCDRDECGWIMQEGHTVKRIVKAYLIQRFQEAEAKGDEDEMRRMEFYLLDYAD